MSWSEKAKATAGAVEGKITDYTFMDSFPFGDEKKEDDTNIYMLLEITPDGADEPVQRSLYLGSGQYLTIEEDGKVLKSTDEENTPRLYDKGEVFKFVESLESAGFPAESNFPDPNETKTIDLRGMLGWRVRIVNEIDEEAQLGIGKKKWKGAGTPTRDQLMEAGKRKVTKGNHKGKSFNVTWTKVSKVFDPPESAVSTKGVKKATNGSGKHIVTKGKSQPVETDEDATIDIEPADEFLISVLRGQTKNNSINKVDLSLAITRQAAKDKMDGSQRDELRRLLTTEDYLVAAAERGVVEFDVSSRKQVVSLSE